MSGQTSRRAQNRAANNEADSVPLRHIRFADGTYLCDDSGKRWECSPNENGSRNRRAIVDAMSTFPGAIASVTELSVSTQGASNQAPSTALFCNDRYGNVVCIARVVNKVSQIDVVELPPPVSCKLLACRCWIKTSKGDSSRNCEEFHLEILFMKDVGGDLVTLSDIQKEDLGLGEVWFKSLGTKRKDGCTLHEIAAFQYYKKNKHIFLGAKDLLAVLRRNEDVPRIQTAAASSSSAKTATHLRSKGYAHCNDIKRCAKLQPVLCPRGGYLLTRNKQTWRPESKSQSEWASVEMAKMQHWTTQAFYVQILESVEVAPEQTSTLHTVALLNQELRIIALQGCQYPPSQEISDLVYPPDYSRYTLLCQLKPNASPVLYLSQALWWIPLSHEAQNSFHGARIYFDSSQESQVKDLWNCYAITAIKFSNGLLWAHSLVSHLDHCWPEIRMGLENVVQSSARPQM